MVVMAILARPNLAQKGDDDEEEEPVKSFGYADNPKARVRVSYHGTRLHVTGGGVVDTVYVDDASVRWTWNWVEGDKFQWKSADGKFLRANSDGTVDLAVNPTDSTLWTKAVVNSRNTWRSIYNTYMRAYPDGRVDLAPEVREWETWDD